MPTACPTPSCCLSPPLSLASRLLHQADIVVVLSREGGRVAECGPPAQLLAAGGAFAALMKEAEAEQHAHEQEQEQEGAAKDKTTEAKEGVGAVAAEAKPNGEQEAEGAKKAAAATAAEGGGGASAGATAAPPQQGQVVRITADERSGEGVTVGTTMAHYLSECERIWIGGDSFYFFWLEADANVASHRMGVGGLPTRP